MDVKPGIQVLIENRLNLLTGKNVGAVVHPASVLPDYVHSSDALSGIGGFHLVSLFGPQHGARGEKQANMIESDSYRDQDLDIPVHSLYGTTRIPSERMLHDVDILLFDLQDVGTRVYTFIHTMTYCMEACARYGKKFIVLDRPNPITGVHVEGNLLQSGFRSFVGLRPIPMRHGMTVGELALMFNSEFDIHCDLTVIEMEGWQRNKWFDETGLPWVFPSPNLPTLDSAIVYPGTVLFEGTCVSEGRGTTHPFEIIGAPYIRGRKLAERLNGHGLPGVYFRPVFFQPTFHKWAGEVCGGVQIHITDREVYEPYLTGIVVLVEIYAMFPKLFEWLAPPYEYEYEKMPIEILCGCGEVPKMIESGVSPDAVRRYWSKDLEAFSRRRSRYLLYG
ncbi:MAG: DUF1343 domain-containing protein [Acidobacteriota bacterium]